MVKTSGFGLLVGSGLVLLRIANLQPNLRIFLRARPKLLFFCGLRDCLGSSVCKSIFAYKVAVFKRRCITQWLLAAVIVLLAAIVIRKGGGGQWHYDHCIHWSGAHRAASCCLTVIGKGSANVHGARCVINLIDTKACLMLSL